MHTKAEKETNNYSNPYADINNFLESSGDNDDEACMKERIPYWYMDGGGS